MSSFDFDLIVLGAGSGGVRASRVAAGLGKRVAVVEPSALGGTCVNVGCVPKKLFYYAAHYREDFQQSKGFGWQMEAPQFDWSTLLGNKNAEIKRLNGIYKNLLQQAGVTLIQGYGQFLDPHTLQVNGKKYSAEHFIVATGGRPFVPELEGKEHLSVSDDIFSLPTLPRRAMVVGGGYIAIELAGVLSGLGVDTQLVHRRDRFLRLFDEDIQREITSELEKTAIQLMTPLTVDAVARRPDQQLEVTLSNGEVVLTDFVLCATGRVPNSDKLGLENTAVETAPNGAIRIDTSFKTAEDSIYAIGDVIDRVQLTPVAIAEAMEVVGYLYQDKDVQLTYRYTPSAVFSQPNVACVGLTESKARKLHKDLRIYKSKFRHLKHTLSGSDEKTFMKLIVNNETDRVIGVHMVGAEAGEIIQGIAIAMQAGVTKAQFDATIGVHPTAAEEFVTMSEAE